MKGNHPTPLLSSKSDHLKSSYTRVLSIIFIELVCVGYITLHSSFVPSHHRPVPVSKPVAARKSVHHTPQFSISRWSSRNHCNVTGFNSWENGLVTLLQPKIKASCEALRKGDERELIAVKKQLQSWVSAESDEGLLERLNNCSHIVDEYSNNFYVSLEEEKFPVAYILVVYTNVQQVLRLLKVIYRPHNLYCIHPDAKQEPKFIRAFQAISRCLDNVFVASKLEKVYYAHHSIMDAQLNCMQDLMRFKPSRWRYAINLCGRELPLKTNREIVQSLIKLNGSSATNSGEVPPNMARLNFRSVLFNGTEKKLGPVLYGLQFYKSISYMALTRP